MKVCCRCKFDKPLSEFNIRKKANDGLDYYCKKCTHKKNKLYYLNNIDKERKRALKFITKNPDRNWSTGLKRKFGITKSQYNEMFKHQNGNCAICSISSANLGKKLSVDHCHKTGKVRGLLCNNCNMAIGVLKDDPNLILKAHNYLMGYEK